MTLPGDPSEHGTPTPDPHGHDPAQADPSRHDPTPSAAPDVPDAPPPSHAPASGVPQGEKASPVTTAPGDPRPASPKHKKLPFRRHPIESEEVERHRRIVRNLRLIFGFCAVISLYVFLFFGFFDSILWHFRDRTPSPEISQIDPEAFTPPDYDAWFAAELEQTRPAPGESPHEPGSPLAIRQEILEAIIRERAEQPPAPTPPPLPEPPAPRIDEDTIYLLIALIPILFILCFSVCVWKARTHPCLTIGVASVILLTNLFMKMAFDPPSSIGSLWIVAPGVLLYMLYLGIVRTRVSNAAARNTPDPAAPSPDGSLTPHAPDVAHAVAPDCGNPSESAQHARTPPRPRSYHGLEIRCVERLRNQRVLFGILGVLALVSAAILFYHSRSGRYGLSKEAPKLVGPLARFSMYQKPDKERQQRASKLFYTYYDMDDAPPMILWRYVDEEVITPHIVIRGMPVGYYRPVWFGIRGQPSIKGFPWQIREELQRRWDRKSAEGRHFAFAMVVMLVPFSLLCFASIWLVKGFPTGAPFAGLLLYSMGLWQIRGSWHMAIPLAMPVLLGIWIVLYRPLLEGFLLGIQMRRERNSHPENPTAAP